jgi:ASPIC and UnbV
VDVSEGSGADGSPEARGLVVFDAEGDGDLDLFVANFRSQSALLERTNVSRSWIGFWLESPGGNRWGVGAQIAVESGGKTRRRYMDGIDFLGQSILPAHFGLDREGSAERVVVTWPDGSVDSWTDLTAGLYHTLSKGRGTSTAAESEVGQPVAWPPYPIPASTHVFVPVAGRVDVFDLLGRLLARRAADSNGRVSLGDLPSGVLFLVGANGRAHVVLHK